jgi:hypothetical protein
VISVAQIELCAIAAEAQHGARGCEASVVADAARAEQRVLAEARDPVDVGFPGRIHRRAVLIRLRQRVVPRRGEFHVRAGDRGRGEIWLKAGTHLPAQQRIAWAHGRERREHRIDAYRPRHHRHTGQRHDALNARFEHGREVYGQVGAGAGLDTCNGEAREQGQRCGACRDFHVCDDIAPMLRICYAEEKDRDFIRWTSNLLRSFLDDGRVGIVRARDRPDLMLASIWRPHRFPAGVPVALVSNENWQVYPPHFRLRRYKAVIGVCPPPHYYWGDGPAGPLPFHPVPL